MDKRVKKGLWLFAIALVVAAIGNIGFAVFNTVATPMTNQLALGQMTNDSAVADTVGRIAAEGKIWGTIQFITNGIAMVFGILGLVVFAKVGIDKYKENA